MYETQITSALDAAELELQDAASFAHSMPGELKRECQRVRPYLKDSLSRLVGALDTKLKATGHKNLLPVLLGNHSNFLLRAALDLLGPCLYAAALAKQGEWSIVDRYKQVGVRHALGGIARNLAGLAVTQTENRTDRVWRFLNHILEAHVEYAADVLGHLSRDRALLNSAFAITGAVQRMNFTGSDPHQCAQRVILLTFACGGRVVYKPTDLTFQLLLMGDAQSYTLSAPQHTALHPYSQSLFASLQMELPLVRIVAMPPSAGHYGYMQFIAKDEILARDTHAAYYRKLGKLAAVAAIFGLTDLHEENVMVTARGPWLIDAEMGFAYPRQANINLLEHSCLNRVLNIKPPDANVLGGCFDLDFDARNDEWTALTVSVPHDADEVNAGFRSALGGNWVSAKPHAAELLAGAYAGVDGVVARLIAVHEWLVQFSVIKPYARLLLSTSEMVRNHVTGVTDALNGTPLTQTQALAGSMNDWLTWFGGQNGAVPGAWYQPHSRQTLNDPSGAPGVSYATAATGGASAATLQEVRTQVTQLNQRVHVTQLKARLKANFESVLLGGANIRLNARVPVRGAAVSSL